jgi:hypothetical protein
MDTASLDLTQLIGVIGVPGALCVLLIKSYRDMQKSIDGNTKVLYLIAGKIGVSLTPKEGENTSGG